MLFSNTDGRTYAKETPRSVLVDICSSWNTSGSVCSAGSGSGAALTRSATWCQLRVSPAAPPPAAQPAQGCLCPQKAHPTTHRTLLALRLNPCVLIHLSLLHCLRYLHSFYSRLVLQQ